MGGGEGLVVRKYCDSQNQKKHAVVATVNPQTKQQVKENVAAKIYEASNVGIHLDQERASSMCLSADASDYLIVIAGSVRCSGKTKNSKRCRRTTKNSSSFKNGFYYCAQHKQQVLIYINIY